MAAEDEVKAVVDEARLAIATSMKLTAQAGRRAGAAEATHNLARACVVLTSGATPSADD